MCTDWVSSRDLVHRAEFSALLIDTNGSPTHLQTDEQVAFFVGGKSQDVRKKEDALALVRAFADLRSYKIVESAPQFPDTRPLKEQPARKETDYTFIAEDLTGRWRVYATFMTSEYSGRYERYILDIFKAPGSGIAIKPPVMIRLRNYVY